MAAKRSRAITVTFLFIWLLVFSGHSLAAPNISGVSGTLNHGSTVTINGSGFEAKGGTDANKPLVWADFETSINPTPLGVVTAWSLIQQLSLHTDAPQHGLSTQNVVGTFIFPTALAPVFGVYRSYTSKVYLYGKRFYGYGQPDNQKTFLLDGSPGGRSLTASTATGGIFYAETCSSDPDRFQGISWIQNSWVIEEFRIDLGTIDNCGGNSGNGFYQWVRNGVQAQLDSTLSTGTTNGATYTKLIVMNNFTDTPNPPANGNHVYMDNLYVDDTWAHVIIGNASTLAASTQREIQIPSAWSDTSIRVTVNRGAFTSLANTYLYIIDKNGLVNAQGFPLCSSGCTTALPSPPKNLKAQ